MKPLLEVHDLLVCREGQPVVEVDHRPVGNGKAGPITRKLLKLYSDVIRGRNRKYMEWCTPVYRGKKGA